MLNGLECLKILILHYDLPIYLKTNCMLQDEKRRVEKTLIEKSDKSLFRVDKFCKVLKKINWAEI